MRRPSGALEFYETQRAEGAVDTAMIHDKKLAQRALFAKYGKMPDALSGMKRKELLEFLGEIKRCGKSGRPGFDLTPAQLNEVCLVVSTQGDKKIG